MKKILIIFLINFAFSLMGILILKDSDIDIIYSLAIMYIIGYTTSAIINILRS